MSSNDYKMWELDQNHREIAEHIGLDAFNKLMWLCGGEFLYIPKQDKAWRRARNEKIVGEYGRYSVKELARKYSLSERRIRQIIDDENQVQ
ncbi:MAG: hypothetical protein IKU13_06825 [Clostridia bacterium]|nr:hypothetical protein [Clostridia bacterium]